jgi:NAD(P)-dependent dehydrogenase (short-subunit alcohol dehydrogenase family)
MSWDVAGKVCLITGANTGIGRVTAVELARKGARIVLAGRSAERTQPVVDEIRALGGEAEFLPLDLGSLASVRTAAATFLASGRPLELLVLNAGLAGFRGLTEDGFEVHFGTNHLGHFLLTCLLRERLVASAPARVVVVASRAHYRARDLDLDSVRRPTASVTGFAEYGVSKLANVLFASELGRRLVGTGVTTYSLHPGVVASDVWRRVPWPFRSLIKLWMITNEEGAATTLHCATAPTLASESGLYYDKCAPKKASRLARDEALAATLWRKSEAWTGCSFDGAPPTGS